MDDQPPPGAHTIEGVCGNCFFWQPVELKSPVTIGQPKRGMCFGVPATPVPQYDQRGNVIGQMDMRSAPPAEHRCCALFMPRPLESEPALQSVAPPIN